MKNIEVYNDLGTFESFKKLVKELDKRFKDNETVYPYYKGSSELMHEKMKKYIEWKFQKN